MWFVTADTGSAGVGELAVEVKVGGRSVPVKTVDKGFRIFGVQFTPCIAARHLVCMRFAGQRLTGKLPIAPCTGVAAQLTVVCKRLELGQGERPHEGLGHALLGHALLGQECMCSFPLSQFQPFTYYC